MKTATRLFCLLVLAISISGCAVYPRAISKPRLFGDTYVVKVEPAEIVVPDTPADQEAQLLSTLQQTGYVFNETGICTVAVELPANSFEFVAKTTFGDCPAEIPAAFSGTRDVTQSTDRNGRKICEYWHATNQVFLAPGRMTPKMRAQGGTEYALNLTYTPLHGGLRPIKRVHYLQAVYNTGFNAYKGFSGDWFVALRRCPVYQ